MSAEAAHAQGNCMSNPLERWVSQTADLTKPDRVVWCDGSEEEARRLTDAMLADGTLLELNQKTNPGSYLHRSHPSDVARTEKVTFTCVDRKVDAGPTNNWMSPQDARDKVGPLFRGCMTGRTMYVVPYLMGPPGSPYAKVGVELTDSAYVVLNLRIMTRMGRIALDHPGAYDDFVPGLHSLGDLNPDRRYILHFLDERLVWSIGSGYGGNALLSKKCFALRLAGHMARREGWLAEHMLILGLQDPQGEITYMAAAFPSACGKTNLAMLQAPAELAGWKVWTVGEDIAWLHPGPDGRLWAINPEAGFFGVAPGTSAKTNANAMATISADTIFTNVAITPDRKPWWEGIGGEPPAGLTDWQGRPWDAAKGPAAHPNSRFTASADRCPTMSPRRMDPQGVPISAIIFGARRAALVPLVYESYGWEHGVLVGASMASESTAAATGAVGVLKRDPMAMMPFCAYNMADYFQHWLDTGARLKKPPSVFRVNWFRKGADGKYLWPGFGQNLRVLMWALDRIRGKAGAIDTPIGRIPTPGSLNLDGLDIPKPALDELFRVDRDQWAQSRADTHEFFNGFDDRFPQALWDEWNAVGKRFETVKG